ncbi:hypothetical protein Dimus_039625 [Dionaea muscipula]
MNYSSNNPPAITPFAALVVSATRGYARIPPTNFSLAPDPVSSLGTPPHSMHIYALTPPQMSSSLPGMFGLWDTSSYFHYQTRCSPLAQQFTGAQSTLFQPTCHLFTNQPGHTCPFFHTLSSIIIGYYAPLYESCCRY